MWFPPSHFCHSLSPLSPLGASLLHTPFLVYVPCFLYPHPILPHHLLFPSLGLLSRIFTSLSLPTICTYPSEARIWVEGRRWLSEFSGLCFSTSAVYPIHTVQSILSFRHHQLNPENRTLGSLRDDLHVLLHKVKCFGIMGSSKVLKILYSSQGPWWPHVLVRETLTAATFTMVGLNSTQEHWGSMHSKAEGCRCWMGLKKSNSPFIPALSITNIATTSGLALKAELKV